MSFTSVEKRTEEEEGGKISNDNLLSVCVKVALLLTPMEMD